MEQSNDESAVLLANASFYRAFSESDFTAMRALWALRAPLSCFHPGSQLLLGREAVMTSWQHILQAGQRFTLRCDAASVSLFGDTALVLCYEGGEAEPAHLAATNVFIREDQNWRMVHHQAGPLSIPMRERRATSILN